MITRTTGTILITGCLMLSATTLVADASSMRAHAAAVSVTAPTDNFTEADMVIYHDDRLSTCPVILEPNSGSGRPLLVKVTIDSDSYPERNGYTLPACQFTRSGYMFAGWDAYDACNEGDLGYYIYRKGNVRVGGGYTGTYQPGFFYEVCGTTVLRAKWNKNGQSGVDVPDEWRKARTLNGVYGDYCEDPMGTAQLKCGKANRQGIAKVSLTITPLNGKKRTYRSVAVDVSQRGEVEVRWPQQSYAVTIYWDGSFFGEPIYGSRRPACFPDAVWSANVGGELYKTAYFTFINEEVDWEAMWHDALRWSSDYKKINEAFYRTPVYMNGRRWTFEKNSTVRYSKKWLKDGWPYLPTCEECAWWTLDTAGGTKMNVHALKLSYAYKTGIFKGGYYMLGGGKKAKATVKGVVVDGIGYATVANGYRSWTVTVE